MKKGDNSTTYLFMAGLIAMVAIVALVLSNIGSLEGAAFFVDERVEESQRDCTDDDPSNDFSVAGTTKLRKVVYKDHCEDDYLHQHYCKSRKHVSHTREYLCPNGCQDGACLA